jgi:Arc/MetJ-type ribon-helix-helix transcriptional regulator
MTQRPLAVRLPEETINGLDRLVADGWYVTRSAGIKDALDKLLATFERQRIDEAIIAGYEKQPLTDDELALLDVHAGMSVRLLDDEEW